jgi:hypothetical protein
VHDLSDYSVPLLLKPDCAPAGFQARRSGYIRSVKQGFGAVDQTATLPKVSRTPS